MNRKDKQSTVPLNEVNRAYYEIKHENNYEIIEEEEKKEMKMFVPNSPIPIYNIQRSIMSMFVPNSPIPKYSIPKKKSNLLKKQSDMPKKEEGNKKEVKPRRRSTRVSSSLNVPNSPIQTRRRRKRNVS